MQAAEQGLLNLDWARRILDGLVNRGLAFVCASPGARDLPLLQALREREDLSWRACVDERAAAYRALGWIKGQRARGKQDTLAAVICTSGSAVLNLLPAVAEALEDGLPLLVLSADRPIDELGRGANQTLGLELVAAACWRFSRQLPLPDKAGIERLDAWCQEMVQKALVNQGPARFNLPFTEPLLPEHDLDADLRTPVESASVGLAPAAKPGFVIPDDFELPQGKRGLIWACQLEDLQERKAAREWARRLDWPLLLDAGAGLLAEDSALGVLHHGEWMDAGLLQSCDTVIQLGRRPVSRRLLEVLSPVLRLVVDAHPGEQNPSRASAQRLQCGPAEALALLETRFPAQKRNDEWIRLLMAAEKGVEQELTQAEQDDELSEVIILRALQRALPANSGLFTGNSLPVRLLDQSSLCDTQEIATGMNRGHSGIDGLLASACGFQEGLARPTALLIGDLSLLHDLSSLSLIEEQNLLIVLINNGGGGIFDLHPATRDRNWARFPVKVPFAELAQEFGIPARRVTDLTDLRLELQRWQLESGARFVECLVPAGGHAGFQSRLKSRLS